MSSSRRKRTRAAKDEDSSSAAAESAEAEEEMAPPPARRVKRNSNSEESTPEKAAPAAAKPVADDDAMDTSSTDPAEAPPQASSPPAAAPKKTGKAKAAASKKKKKKRKGDSDSDEEPVKNDQYANEQVDDFDNELIQKYRQLNLKKAGLKKVEEEAAKGRPKSATIKTVDATKASEELEKLAEEAADAEKAQKKLDARAATRKSDKATAEARDAELDREMEEQRKKVAEFRQELKALEDGMTRMKESLAQGREKTVSTRFPLFKAAAKKVEMDEKLTIPDIELPALSVPEIDDTWPERLKLYFRTAGLEETFLLNGALSYYVSQPSTKLPKAVFTWLLESYLRPHPTDPIIDHELEKIVHHLASQHANQHTALWKAMDAKWFIGRFKGIGLGLEVAAQMTDERLEAWSEQLAIRPPKLYSAHNVTSVLSRLLDLLSLVIQHMGATTIGPVASALELTWWLYRISLDPFLRVPAEVFAALQGMLTLLLTHHNLTARKVAAEFVKCTLVKDKIYNPRGNPPREEIILSLTRATPRTIGTVCNEFAPAFAMEWARTILLIKLKEDESVLTALKLLAKSLYDSFKLQVSKDKATANYNRAFAITELICMSLSLDASEIRAQGKSIGSLLKLLGEIVNLVPEIRQYRIARAKAHMSTRVGLVEHLFFALVPNVAGIVREAHQTTLNFQPVAASEDKSAE